ncbi:2-dehydropantoate 2-reductase [Variovorax sp. WS11]|uniref:2-dehydropantoate 2-reductase n=1 Tax=Variovorax sp. WS11 TaxID=1105204 RepID=UPI000D0E189C|nr:2-dehydropantoate 2-reductase [Variovorax sp. WS11]NDZ16542.1 2-dehydropantoate 2-reductase [Variovorax sp. WS11]PSL85883.1 2-dehydropantoate 2-reductase [Variovorax sp. WS11]
MAEEALPVDVLVMGAGAIGCYIGGSLASEGVRVLFVGRPRVLEPLERHGLRLSDLDDGERYMPPGTLQVAERIPPGVRPGLVLLTVKSGATAQAAAELGAVLPARTPVISLQNGVSNASTAAHVAPTLQVLPGMVPYNVAEIGPGAFHRGTTGRLAVQDDAVLRPWLAVFERAGVPIDRHKNMLPVQWGKLLLNLNNPVNALSGLPLRRQLMDRGYRRCLAALMDEALEALSWAHIKPAQLAAVPPRRMPVILRLPNPVFRVIAARMLRIDDKARSSMADDLALGRRTEIDALCGEVVRLARSNGARAPMSAKMVELVEAWPERPHALSAQELLAALGLK